MTIGLGQWGEGHGAEGLKLLGEPMLVGGEKGQVWWKLLVACVVYFGDT